jgi:hypothetical protein
MHCYISFRETHALYQQSSPDSVGGFELNTTSSEAEKKIQWVTSLSETQVRLSKLAILLGDALALVLAFLAASALTHWLDSPGQSGLPGWSAQDAPRLVAQWNASRMWWGVSWAMGAALLFCNCDNLKFFGHFHRPALEAQLKVSRGQGFKVQQIIDTARLVTGHLNAVLYDRGSPESPRVRSQASSWHPDWAGKLAKLNRWR